MLESYEKEMDDLVEQEREKHFNLWKSGFHDEHSSNDVFANRVLWELNPQWRESICDWGLGRGLAAQRFKEHGMKVEGVDLVTCIDCHFDGKVYNGPLWGPLDIDPTKKYTYGYCANVLEYLPAGLITTSLKTIKDHTHEECWFLIGGNLSISWLSIFASVYDKLHYLYEDERLFIRAFSRVRND